MSQDTYVNDTELTSSVPLQGGMSQFLAGLLVGLLIATIGFAFFTRSQNQGGGTAKLAKVLRLGHSVDQNHPVHRAMVRMAELLEQKSGGQLTLKIFPNGQLGTETEIIEQLQRGVLAMAKTSAAPLESFIPEMAIFGTPYLFRDENHYWKVLEGDIGKQMLVLCQEGGLHGLCYYDAGARSFYTIDRPILSPSDLTGLKIRVIKSKTSMDMVDALGASPTPIPYGELYTALQQSMVDGAENNPPSFYNSRHFEVCKHYSIDEHTRVPDMLIYSEKLWKTLSAQEQQWVREAAIESVPYQRKIWKEDVEKNLASARAAGVTIHYPDKQPFVDKVKAMHQSYEGTAVGDLLTRIKEE